MRTLPAISVALLLSVCLGAIAPSKKTPVEELKDRVMALEAEVVQLKAAIEDMKRQVAESSVAAKSSPPKQSVSGDISDALRQNKVIVGMSADQASSVIKRLGKSYYAEKSERLVGDKRIESEKWTVNEAFALEISSIELENGIVVRVKY